ncbi:nitrate reductase subunit beta, partial [Staphylococcus aureus]|nr:nitrate reductase subunit beta [Staphylococcus aureus]
QKETYLDTYHAQGSTGYNYGGEHFGDNCEGCGVAVGSGKTGQEIYNENFYGGIFRD